MLALTINLEPTKVVESIDYREYFKTIIQNCNDILDEVKNHQTTTDLKPVTDDLDRIILTMQSISEKQGVTNETLKAILDNLLNQFKSIVDGLGDFKSANLDALDALKHGLSVSFEKTDSLLGDAIAAIKDGAALKTRQLFSYGAIVSASEKGATITIPAGATEISLIPRNAFAYTVNGKIYEPGLVYLREFRAPGNSIVLEPETLVELPAGAKLHVSYTAIETIGEAKIENATAQLDSYLNELLDRAQTVLGVRE